MNIISKSVLAVSLLAVMPLGAAGQLNIDFESPESYKSVGIYDVWEQSPFRTGELKGNFTITPNPNREVSEVTGDIPNDSENVLGAQRSRFGSNRFGVRVDLNEAIPLGTTTQYFHVMVLTPKEGRVMLVGLGSREERLGQNPYTEQFWTLSSTTIKPGEWCDAVFAVRTNNGINLRSLVLVPDCESPHNLTEDFLFYIDNITVNDSPIARISNDFYPISGDKSSTAMSRTDRYSTKINLRTGSTTQRINIPQNSNHKLYQDVLSQAFFAKPGQSVTPSITYNGNYMHAYCFVDYNGDGQFSAKINDDGTPAEGSELVSYNYYNGKNSTGKSAGSNLGTACGTMPAFQIPEDLAPGMYRIRYKIDWDCIDPAGNSAPGNLIANNGGVIADAMLCVYGDKVELNDFQLNGEVLGANGEKLSSLQVPADQEYTIRSAPEKGFHNGGIDVKCGYNLNGDQIDKYGNYQYITFEIPLKSFSEDNTYTIPAKQMRANLLFNGRMVEDGSDDPDAETAYEVNFPKTLQITRTDRRLNSFSLTTGGETVTVDLGSNTDNYVYVPMLDVEVPVKAGDEIIPAVNYTGNAMHTYWYVDLNEDGEFDATLNDNGTPAAELLSYSYADGKNSLGETVAPSMTPSVNHPFVIRADIPAGVYRARFKIDWNFTDPKGQYGLGKNDIHDNGGYVVDFMIHVYDDTTPVSVNATDESGNLVAGKTEIGSQPVNVARNEPLAVSATTTKNILIEKLTARYGYHLDYEKSHKMGNTYWNEIEITPQGDTYTLPASIMDRPVKLIAKFEGITGIQEITVDSITGKIYNLQGIEVTNPTTGVYIVNGRKVMVK